MFLDLSKTLLTKQELLLGRGRLNQPLLLPYRFGIVSNTSPHLISAALETLLPADRIAAHNTNFKHSPLVKKPSPWMLWACARAMGIEPQFFHRCVYIGDKDTDREAAFAAGFLYAHPDSFLEVEPPPEVVTLLSP
jgi:beta-phosphoglucomutase-like phosphatase (HAD superfamily)